MMPQKRIVEELRECIRDGPDSVTPDLLEEAAAALDKVTALSTALRALVEKWRKHSETPGWGEYYVGMDAGFNSCADAVEAILEAKPEQP